MPVKFVKPGKARKLVKPVAPVIALDQPGRLRVANLMALLGIGRTAVYERVADGRLPAPDGHDGRPYWDTHSINTVLKNLHAVDGGEK